MANNEETAGRGVAYLNRQRAALENCKKSTGPKDCSRVRFNTIKLGLRAKSPVIPGEDPSELERLRESVYDTLSPRNEMETHLAEQVVFGFWRMQRGIRAEYAILESHGDFDTTNWGKIMDMDYLDKIARFENHAANQVDRALAVLERMRELNKDNGNVS